MEISINSYNETEEQRTIRILKEISETQEKLIKEQTDAIHLRDQVIQMRDKQRDGLVELVAELIKEIDEWRTKAGQKKLSEEYFEACAKDPDPETMIVKMKNP